MTKKSFYLTLNIMNVLLCAYLYVMIVSYILLTLDDGVLGLKVVFSTILIKIFLLYILFKLIKKFFPNFVLSKIAEELKTNNLAKEKALLLAFIYDVTLILLNTFIVTNNNSFFDWSYTSKWDNFSNFNCFVITYEILTFGGILMFYLSAFCLWKIEDKIKDFYNKKRLNNKSAK